MISQKKNVLLGLRIVLGSSKSLLVARHDAESVESRGKCSGAAEHFEIAKLTE